VAFLWARESGLDLDRLIARGFRMWLPPPGIPHQADLFVDSIDEQQPEGRPLPEDLTWQSLARYAKEGGLI
jgi:hypothetical protein